MEMAELLIKKGADFNDEIRDVNGLNARDYAASMGNEHILEMAKGKTNESENDVSDEVLSPLPSDNEDPLVNPFMRIVK